MTSVMTIQEAEKLALNSYLSGDFSTADITAMNIYRAQHNNFLANKVLGLLALDVGKYPTSLTFLRNAQRVSMVDDQVSAAIDQCVSKMQERQEGRDIYVIGDSHTEPFRRIERTVVRWVGPVTMRRISEEKIRFLDYRLYGVRNGDTVITIFGEIDGRAHIMKDNLNITQRIDNLISNYLKAIREAFNSSGAARQIVSSIMPPGRNPSPGHPVVGSLEERIECAKLMNERLAFGCNLLGFHFLNQSDLFADSTGALDDRYTKDGVHVGREYAEMLAKPLSAILSTI